MMDLYPTIDKVDSSRGAPMGRHPWYNKAVEGPVKVFRPPIDAGGYDPGGAYYGDNGTPVWCATDEQDFRAFRRAQTFEDALRYFQTQYPFITAFDRLPISELLGGYVETALWTGIIETEDQDSEHYDVSFYEAGYSLSSLTPEALELCRTNVTAFFEAIRPILTPGFNFWRAGSVLWYSSNGHGIGWADDDWGGLEDALEAATPRYQDYHLWLTEDDKVGIE